MTREDAIYLLRNTAWLAPSLEPVDEAIEMAIEALTHDKHTETHDVRLDFKPGELFLTLNEAVKVAVNQFDVDPVIARQEFEQKCYIPCSDYEKGFYDEAWQDALDRAEGAIGNLPSAEPEPHWIPFSERLPKTNEVVLLCGKYNIFCGYHNTKGKWYSITGDGWETNMDFPSSNNGDILAWMPLPEPYKEEE